MISGRKSHLKKKKNRNKKQILHITTLKSNMKFKKSVTYMLLLEINPELHPSKSSEHLINSREHNSPLPTWTGFIKVSHMIIYCSLQTPLTYCLHAGRASVQSSALQTCDPTFTKLTASNYIKASQARTA